MKQGWEYKKLGEVCEVVSGSTPQTNVPEYWGEGHYWVTPAELNDTIVYIDKTERQITDEALTKTKLRLLPVGTVLLSSRAPIGKVAITKTEMYCNQGFKNCICSDSIYNKYLFYFLRLKKEYLNSLGRGATFKEISKSIVESITIPLPPKSTQLSIVSELDKINELIRLKKEQLKDYDNLAQSIFYEMFGDPVENEKEWEVKKIGDLAIVKTGPFGSMLHKEDYITDGIPLVNPIHMKNFKIVPDMEFTISKEKACELENYMLQNNDVVFARRGDIGRCAIVSEIEKGYLCGTGSLFVRFTEDIESVFIMYIIRSESFSKHLVSKAKGATMLNINSNTIADLEIPLPPLPLQHLFAQRIEQIERQKSAVQKSITDLETLLASRMQYWFE